MCLVRYSYSLSGLLVFVTLCALVLGVRQVYIKSHVDTEIDNLQNHPNQWRRFSAAVALGEMGASARAASPILVDILLQEPLGDWSGNSRGRGIAHALANIGPPAIPDVCNALADPAQRTRGWGMFPPTAKPSGKPLIFAAARELMAGAGPDTQPLVAVLRALQSDPCAHVSAWANEALGPLSRQRSPAPAGDVDSKATIFQVQRPNFEEWIDAWTTRLNSKDAIERAWAAHMLGELARDRRIHSVGYTAQIAALGQALADTDPHVGYQAAYAFRQIARSGHGNAAQAVPTIVEAVLRPNNYPGWNDHEPPGRSNYVELPIASGENAQLGAPQQLMLWPSDWSLLFRLNLINALGEIGPDAGAAVPTLIELLQNAQDARVRGTAVDALGLIGPKATDAVPALLKALQDQQEIGTRVTAIGRIYPTVRESAVKSLIKIDPDAAARAGVKSQKPSPPIGQNYQRFQQNTEVGPAAQSR